MGASSVTGVGNGSSEAGNKGPGNNRNIFVTTNGPHIVASGEVVNTNDSWQINVVIEGLTESPDRYTVVVTQSDWANNDGRGNYPPHIEKLDTIGNNFDDVDGDWEGPMGGFVLHTADNDQTDSSYSRKFGFIVIRNGGSGFSSDSGY
jgi:hypothetical protein